MNASKSPTLQIQDAEELLCRSTQRLVDLRRDPYWAGQMPDRCPPVLWFGDTRNAPRRVLTLAANPSIREYYYPGGQGLLPPIPQRLRALRPGENLESILTEPVLRREVLDGYTSYFNSGRNPFTKWFGNRNITGYRVQRFLRGFGASYYPDYPDLIPAVHIDLCPYATIEKFSALPEDRRAFLLTGPQNIEFFHQLLMGYQPTVLVVFGIGNWQYFCDYMDPGFVELVQGTFDDGGVPANYWIGRASGFQNIRVVGLETYLPNPYNFTGDRLEAYGAYLRDQVGDLK